MREKITQDARCKMQDASEIFLLHPVSWILHPASKFTQKHGQALLELSIFGSIILMLMGLLISYGLRYNFQQEAQMEAYRKALEIAAQQGSASYTLIKDRHIPSIENPFGVGGVEPFAASASVIRDPQADATADDYRGLPKTTIHLEGKMNGNAAGPYNYELPAGWTPQPYDIRLAMAGIREERVKLPNKGDDFGVSWEEAWAALKHLNGGLGGAVEAAEELDDEEWARAFHAYQNLKEKYNMIYGSVSGWPEVNSRAEYEKYREDHSSVELTIVDSCEGEIVDYNSAIRQARLIVDSDFCQKQCELGVEADSKINCTTVCNFGIKVPWYAQGAYYKGSPYNFESVDSFAGIYDTSDNDQWEFPNIENLFVLPVTGKKVQSMGMQPDYTQQITTDFSTQKTEDGQFITTKDNVYWDTTTTRTLLYNDHLDKSSGMAQPSRNLKTEDYSTTRSETETTTWETNTDY